jgi:hypothetical protein
VHLTSTKGDPNVKHPAPQSVIKYFVHSFLSVGALAITT